MTKQGLSGYHRADHLRNENVNKLSEAINTQYSSTPDGEGPHDDGHLPQIQNNDRGITSVDPSIRNHHKLK